MYNWDIQLQANKDNVIILDKKNEKLVGYAAALSTFGKFRGADFSDVEVIIFHEFINTTPFNNIKNEANMLFNLIETVNRNRELDGDEPVKVILLSNANTIDSDIIRALKLGEVIKNMKEQRYCFRMIQMYMFLSELIKNQAQELHLQLQII